MVNALSISGYYLKKKKNQFNQLKYQKEMKDPVGIVLSIIFFYSLKILSVTYREAGAPSFPSQLKVRLVS